MRIAVLTQVAPNPPDAGPKVKTHYTLRTLAEQHEVELITFARSAAEVEAAEQLRAWCTQVTIVPLARSKRHEPLYLTRGWLTRTPFLIARDARATFRQALGDRLRTGTIDLVYADQVSMAQYLPARGSAGPLTVFDAHNAVWELIRNLAPQQPTVAHRLAARVEWRLMRRFEGHACRSADLTFAVSEHDRTALRAAAGTGFPCEVVPIGVEVREVSPVTPRAGATRLLSVATMHYPPNAEAIRWFRDAIWPLVGAGEPRLGVDIVGTRPPADLSAWAAQDERVHVHGYVPEADLADLYRDALAVIVPLRAGSGVRVKILEAMARGLPVISTNIGAEGLEVAAGEHLLIADTPAEFAAAIRALAEDVPLRRRLTAAARARALERYDWRSCNRPLLEAVNRLAAWDGVQRTALASTAVA